ncbi:hypothetical protein [Novosphingobium pentaromativorans]|uniref:SMP-30/Gluconolactonase/LRE-like region domain-containing protein n=1 Tax=Novosphingobium pentaromativorans US6-1 TaxID=1088721 RepID=G6EG76_9SPHN|nr:hypothetical protein [Novosphingobium pentaromativorans]AIT82236.1 hypothetical protein JI59_22245 [Novosphingobium pentaromativorans US6-1]EHJ59765.1 hypothetical protein NSU_3347 [Novosphingobium pentaromativorans US6-1]
MRRTALALFSAIALGGAAAPPGPQTCRPDGDLDYICGPERPEDLLAIPGTKWIVASGFAPGAGLKLVDAPARTYEKWYKASASQIAWDKKHFPNCPAPLDASLFNARGLSLRRIAADTWQLLVVNHGGRESVEAFKIVTGPRKPGLTWIGCQPLPADQVGNATASFEDGTILVTVLTRPGTTIGDFMLGRKTGAVWQWRRGERDFVEMEGTQLPGNNGLEVDPDGNRFYVVGFGLHGVAIYDRRNTVRPLEVIAAPDFMPDNIHWSEGELILAGMRLDEPACSGLRKVNEGKADPMLCHRGWVVGRLDLAAHRIATVAYGTPQAGFNGLSSATGWNGQLWLGSYQSDRIAIVRRADPTPP